MTAALVGVQRWGVTISDHPSATAQGRLNDFVPQLSFGGEHHVDLSHRVGLSEVLLEQRADTFTDKSTARLTNGHHFNAAGNQMVAQHFQLGGLARTIGTLKTQKLPLIVHELIDRL